MGSMDKKELYIIIDLGSPTNGSIAFGNCCDMKGCTIDVKGCPPYPLLLNEKIKEFIQ
jgi:hypothetical protein